jgi:hypothetical protein
VIPHNAQLAELPWYWREKIRELRTENQKMRRERNEARVELAALLAEMQASK